MMFFWVMSISSLWLRAFLSHPNMSAWFLNLHPGPCSKKFQSFLHCGIHRVWPFPLHHLISNHWPSLLCFLPGKSSSAPQTEIVLLMCLNSLLMMFLWLKREGMFQGRAVWSSVLWYPWPENVAFGMRKLLSFPKGSSNQEGLYFKWLCKANAVGICTSLTNILSFGKPVPCTNMLMNYSSNPSCFLFQQIHKRLFKFYYVLKTALLPLFKWCRNNAWSCIDYARSIEAMESEMWQSP